MKVFLTTLMIFCLLFSTSFATLLNTTDQALNKNYGLGANPAAKAYNRFAGREIEGGVTFWNDFKQNKNILDEVEDLNGASFTGSDLDMSKRWPYPNRYVQYTQKTNVLKQVPWIGDMRSWISSTDSWFTVGYSRDTDMLRSYKQKATTDKTFQYDNAISQGFNIAFLRYGLNTNKINKRLYFGIELAWTTFFRRIYWMQNTKLRSSWRGKSSVIQQNTSAPYGSFAMGGIYELNALSKLTFNQKFYGTRYMNQRDYDIWNNKTDVQYNEEVQPETTVGYVHRINPNLEVAGTITSFWDTKYIQDRSTLTADNRGEMDVQRVGYQEWNLTGEYKLENKFAFLPFMKGMAIQPYYGWAKNAYKETADKEVGDEEPVDVTVTGLSVNLPIMANQDLVVGMSNKTLLGNYTGTKIDDTKGYVNYRFTF